MRPQVERSTILARLSLRPGTYLLVTLHRPALVDGPLFAEALESLVDVAEDLPVVYPVHPRARKRLDPRLEEVPGLHLVEPIGYVDFLALEQNARGVITDSGGVQEETTYLRVPCFTLRQNTERPVTIDQGTNRLLGLDPAAIRRVPYLLAAAQLPRKLPSGWDGRASERIAAILAEGLEALPRVAAQLA
jgi:UDP-N-acetylglucosamine 2-epimerase (non-hydrolysing)